MPTMNAGSFNYRATQWIILLSSDKLLHTQLIWHPQTTEDGPVIFIMWINSDSCLRRKAILMAGDQMRSYFGKKKWQICVCSEALKETEKRSCWDVSAEFLPSQEGMKLVKWSFGLVTTLSWQKEILSANISVSVHVCLSLSRSHIHIRVLFHSKCVSHGSRCWNSLSDPSPPVPLFPLSSPFLDIFKRMWRDKRVHTERKWWLLKQSCVPWDYRDFVVIRKESKGNRSAFEISL